MTDLRQIFWLLVVFIVPLFCIVTRRERLLLIWICISVCVNIFDANILINLPAARIAGLLLLPRSLRSLRVVLETTSGTALFLEYAYLFILAVVFGFLFPWPSEDFLRLFNQTAEGRAIIYTIRTTGDLGIALFVSEQVLKMGHPDKVFKYLLVGTSLAAFAGIVGQALQVDLYSLVTGLRLEENAITLRAGGFNYEPKALGLIVAHGLGLSLISYSHQESFKNLALVLLHSLALAFSLSSSGLIAAIAGLIVLFVMVKQIRNLLPRLVVFAFPIAVFVMVWAQVIGTGPLGSQIDLFAQYAELRLTPARFGQDPTNLLEEIVYRSDVFDGSALVFLVENPLYLFIGTGPGLISLPASYYIPNSIYYQGWIDLGTGINNPPEIGALLELSNGGIIGLGLWLIVVFAVIRASVTLCRRSLVDYQVWEFSYAALLLAATIYIFQVSNLSAIWPVFVGTGLAIERISRIHSSEQIRQLTPIGVLLPKSR